MSAKPEAIAPLGRPLHRGFITVSIMLATMLQAVDTTIANVALPRIQGSLSATQDQMAWVLTSYIIASAIMTPLSGWLATRLGRKRIFLYSVVGFTIASALCGAAQSVPEIVAARLFQGICGAALVPMSQAVLLDINPPEHIGRAMAVWSMGVMIGPIIGPALGGWLTDNFSWRWVFYINVPFGILAFLGILSFLPETAVRKLRFDFFGFSALSIAIGALQLMMDRGQLKDWFDSSEICLEATVAFVAFYLFLVHTLTTDEEPFVSPALFKDRNFLTGNVVGVVVGIVAFATLALVPTLLQNLMDYPVLTTGLVTAPRMIGMLFAMFVAGRIIRHVDLRLIMAVGFALTAFSLGQMTGFSLQMDSSIVLWSGVVQGFGMGFIFMPVTVATYARLAPRLRNEGTAIYNLLRNLGSSIGISFCETLLTRNTQILHSSLAAHVTPYNEGLQVHASTAMSTVADLASLNRIVTQQAAMIAYIDDFQLMMVLTVCAIPLVFLFHKALPQRGAGPVVIE